MAAITKQQLMPIAKQHQIKNSAKMKKTELIHAIQLAEGNSDCFGRIPDCAIEECMFRGDCVA